MLARADISCQFMKTRSLCRTVYKMNGFQVLYPNQTKSDQKTIGLYHFLKRKSVFCWLCYNVLQKRGYTNLKRPLQQPHVPSENSHPVFKTREKVRSNIRGRGIRNVPQKRYSEQFFSAFYMCSQVKQSNRQTESEWDMIRIIYLQPNCVTKIFLKSHFNSYYRESSPNVNFISANFITAILQKRIHDYLPYANFGLFYFISAIFWQKIAKKLH